MTEKTLKKLSEELPQAKTFLDNRKKVLHNTNKKDDVRGEIRGYLAAFRTMGAITDVEMRLLLTYYTM